MQEKGNSVWLSLSKGSITASMHLGYSETSLRVGTLRHVSLYSPIYILTAESVSMYPLEGTVRQCLIVPHYPKSCVFTVPCSFYVYA